jgi:hypothetical protein
MGTSARRTNAPEIRGDARGALDVVQVQLGDHWVHLQEEGEALADPARGAEDRDLWREESVSVVFAFFFLSRAIDRMATVAAISRSRAATPRHRARRERATPRGSRGADDRRSRGARTR